MRHCAALVLCALVAGCMSGGSSRVPVPPPEYYVAQDYSRIVQNANHVLSTDWLAWVPGMPERTGCLRTARMTSVPSGFRPI